ncbi:MAG: CoA transferase [Pseudomonadota bacterium]|nr:CoA transferase [Pseudomonadota bacterium]
MSGGILDGIRVLDVASFIAAPAAATVMADFGAEVIKVEPVGLGDPLRYSLRGPGYGHSPAHHEWFVDNRNKKGIALNLKSEEGSAVLCRLCETADVFITNMPLGPRERLRIRYEDIGPLNERLIYASVSAYGEEGEEGDRTGFDSTALWARSGMQDLVKPSPDSPPARSLPGMGDHPTAVSLFGSIMLALYRRISTGKGGRVSTSLMANGAWGNALSIQTVLSGGEVAHRPGREKALSAVNNFYETKDGRWFHLIMITGQTRFPELVAALGCPEIAQDPRFMTTELRTENAHALIAELDVIFSKLTADEVRNALNADGFTFGETHQINDVLTDQQFRASGALRENRDPKGGADLVVDTPLFVDGETKVEPVMAPDLGEHTDDILTEAGFSSDEIERMREMKAIE